MQKELEKTNYEKARPGILDNLLQIPVTATPNWTDAEKQAELDKNAQGILGYVVRWVGQGVVTEPLLHAWRMKVKATA